MYFIWRESLNFGIIYSKSIKRFSSISLLFILLLTSIGLKVNTHVCQGSLKSIGLFVKAKACSTMGESSCTNKSHADGFNRKPCCTDMSFMTPVSKYETNQFTTSETKGITDKVFFKILAVLRTQSNTPSMVMFKDDPPDIGNQNVQTMFQVFLI